MLRLSKKGGLRADRHAAPRGAARPGSSSAPGKSPRATPSRAELLAKVLQRLVRARLLVSVQGTRGGYKLGRPAAPDDGRRRDPGHRRAGRRHRLLAEQPHLRAVRATARSATRSGRSRTRIVDALATVSLAEMAEPVRARRRVAVPLTVRPSTARGVGERRTESTAMSVTRPVYLDHHATTPVDPRVLQAMLPYFNQLFGNAVEPAAPLRLAGGRSGRARPASRWRALDRRQGQGDRVHERRDRGQQPGHPRRRGRAPRARAPRGHRGDRAHAVLDTCRRSARDGWQRDGAAGGAGRPGRSGSLRRGAHRPTTVLVSVMAANNEIGVIQPIAGAGAGLPGARRVAAHRRRAGGGARCRSTSSRAARTWCRSRRTRCTARRASARSTCGARPRVEIEPLVHRRRPGARAASGHARTCRASSASAPRPTLRRQELASRGPRVSRRCAIACWRRCRPELEAVTVNGSMTARLPHNLHVSFAGVDGEALMTGLADDVAASSGSACASGSREPSHVREGAGPRRRRVVGGGALRPRPDRPPRADVDFAADRVVALGATAAGAVAGGGGAAMTTAVGYSAEVVAALPSAGPGRQLARGRPARGHRRGRQPRRRAR